MPKFRKKPVVIEAVQYTGKRASVQEIVALTNNTIRSDADGMFIHTLEGDMRVEKGTYVIKGVQGEFYPCKEDIFLATYEVVTE